MLCLQAKDPCLLSPSCRCPEVRCTCWYWLSCFEIVKFASGTPKPLYAGIDQDFKVTPEQLEEAITDKTKMIIFSSPSNPTGSSYSLSELESLAKVISAKENLFVLADEIYEYILFEGKNPSIASLPNMADKTITINGMSKGFAMTGWRLGYMGAPKWIASACAKVQGQFTSGATAFGQAAATDALMKDPSQLSYMKDKFLERKNLVKRLLDDIPGIKTNEPQGAFYFFPDISAYFSKSNGQRTINNANDFVDVLLDEAHVAVVTGEAFGDSNSFRLSYASSNEILEEAMSRIKKTLSTYS